MTAFFRGLLLLAMIALIFGQDEARADLGNCPVQTILSNQRVCNLDSNNSAFMPQGDCTYGGSSSDQDKHLLSDQSGTVWTESTWSCLGISTQMLKFNFYRDAQGDPDNGPPICAYIDNSNAVNAYFVPMNTRHEWDQFVAYHPGDVAIRYGCPSQTEEDTCGNQYTLPDTAGDDKAVFDFKTQGTYDAQWKCPSTVAGVNGKRVPINSCSIWEKIGETGACVESFLVTFGGSACVNVQQPTDFVLMMDASASLQSLVDSVRANVDNVVATLQTRPDINLTITVVGGDGYTDRFLSPNHQNFCFMGRLFGPAAANTNVVDPLIAAVRSGESTPLDATMRYSATFFKQDTRRHVILAISDGLETCSGNAADAVNAVQTNNQVDVYGIRYVPVDGFGAANDVGAANFFAAMNHGSVNASDSASIAKAMNSVVDDVIHKTCAATLKLYTPGDIGGTPQYTITSDNPQKVKKGNYDGVVESCAGTQVLFTNQEIAADSAFPNNNFPIKGCASP